MRFYQSLIFLLFLTWCLSSCEEPVDLDLDETSRLIVTSHFSQDEDLVVFVTESNTVTSNGPLSFVKNATISVFEGNEFIQVLEFVDGDSESYYTTVDLSPTVGSVYTIQVNVPGRDVITATNYIPEPVDIENVNFVPNFNVDAKGGDSRVNFTVAVSIQDPAEYENFYHIFFYQEMMRYTIDEMGDTIVSSTINTDSKINVEIDDIGYKAEKYNDRSYLIDDVEFNGELKTMNFSGDFTYDPSTYLLGDFIVELRTVSREYYNYWSFITSQNGSGGPLNDFFVLDDNIINGDGIFAGYSSTSKNTKLQD